MLPPGFDLVCGPENVREFNAALRETLPEFADFARELHKTGLIAGLRGCRLMAPDIAEARRAADAPRTVSGLHLVTDSLATAPEWAAAGKKRGGA